MIRLFGASKKLDHAQRKVRTEDGKIPEKFVEIA